MSLLRQYIAPIKYLFIFGLVFPFIYFIPILKDKALTGHVDIYFSMAYANDLAQYWQHLLTGSPYTQWLFQSEGNPPGERAIGLVSILAMLRFTGFGDVTCHYLLISFITSINAISIYLYGHHVKEVKSKMTLLAMSIFFSINSYMVGHMDTVNFLFIPFLLFGMYALDKKHVPNKPLLHGFITGFQIYFSAYLYSAIVAIFFLTTILNIRNVKKYLLFLLGFSISSMPFVAYQALTTSPIKPVLKVLYPRKNVASSYTPNISSLYTNPINPLQNIAGTSKVHNNEVIKLWLYFGNEKWILLFLSILLIRAKITIELTTLALGFFITFGYAKSLDLINTYIPMDFLYLFRFPDRSYIIAILALTIISGMTIYELSKNNKYKNILLSIIFLLIHLGQNGIYPFRKFRLIEPNPEIGSFFKSRPGAVILDLPSDLTGRFIRFGSEENLFNYNLEILYMNWKSVFNVNTLNGVQGYITPSRFSLQEHTNDLIFSDSKENCQRAINRLIHQYKLEYIILHRNIFSQLRLKNPQYAEEYVPPVCTELMNIEISNDLVTIYRLSKSTDPTDRP